MDTLLASAQSRPSSPKNLGQEVPRVFTPPPRPLHAGDPDDPGRRVGRAPREKSSSGSTPSASMARKRSRRRASRRRWR